MSRDAAAHVLLLSETAAPVTRRTSAPPRMAAGKAWIYVLPSKGVIISVFCSENGLTKDAPEQQSTTAFSSYA